MTIKAFLKKHGVRLLAVVIVVALIFGVAAHLLSGRGGVVSSTVNSLASPVRSAATSLAGWLENIYGYLYSYDQLKSENEQLRLELEQAREELRDAAEANEENERLRELLNLADRHSDFVFETAKITSWSSSNWASSFTLSKGSASGIELGDCVVTESGALVGQIAELGEDWATVRTVIDIDTSVGALVGEAGNAAMAIGDFTLMQDGYLKLTYLTEGTQLLIGDAILTSGHGTSFPQGLLIGYISDVRNEAGGQTPYAVIEPACDLDSLVQVFVITDFNIAE